MLVHLVTPPEAEPLTLKEATDHLRLDAPADNATVSSLILAARQHVEEVCWRGLVTQTWERVLECFPLDRCWPLEQQGIELPKGNLGAVVSVKYIDATGTEQTVDPSLYSVDAVSEPGRLRLAYAATWPSPRSQWDAVRVRYTVGWAVDDVPQPIKQALLLLVSQMYEHRTPEISGTIISSVGFAVNALLAPYRLVRF